MSEYDCVAKGPLKLKGESGMIKKKKKKNKKKEKSLEEAVKHEREEELEVELEEEVKEKKFAVRTTKAELMFQKQQENVQNKRLMKIASMTHKQRVEEFNKHLDSLTEHFDIPKVSWTK